MVDGNELLEQGKALLEQQLEQAIEKHLDAGLELLLNEVKEKTPPLVDLAIDAVKPALKALVKEELLKQVEKISERV